MIKLNKKQEIFLSFLESLKTRKTAALVESVKDKFILSECGGYGCADGDCDIEEECGDAKFENFNDYGDEPTSDLYDKFDDDTRLGSEDYPQSIDTMPDDGLDSEPDTEPEPPSYVPADTDQASDYEPETASYIDGVDYDAIADRVLREAGF